MSELYPELGDFFHEPAGSDISVCGARHREHTLPVPSGTSGGVEKESLRRLVAIYQSVIL